MTAQGRRPGRWYRRLPRWAQTVRFRLAVTNSLAVFGLGAVVIVVLYAGVASTVDQAALRELKQLRAELGMPADGPGSDTLHEAVSHYTKEKLAEYSLFGLGALFVLSAGTGWMLAGRALRPVDRITTTAREISGSDLSGRIRLQGPDDELRRLADTVDDMLDRLDGAFSGQRRILDDVSHELRTPLAVIQTNLEAVLSRDDVTEAERRQAAAVVGRATERMTHLVEDLLSSARRTAPAFGEQDLDAARVAAEAADEFAAVAAEQGVRVRRRLCRGRVVADAVALSRAVGNLLSNAVRFAPRGSTVLVATGQWGEWAYIAVRDEGPGIPEEHQSRIFDRFWRGRARGGADGEGERTGQTGLGLAIVRQIVEAHGGSVAVHSRPGEGSTFVLWLPDLDTRRAGGGESGGPPPADDPVALAAPR
ncbi:sensor histidine kinase [Allonocardiopsis opalescens]|uniref:histidine kinase n=1 Tax=Allonocardiopsis opalescens TaxID=1144618 RepID=A0A2T0PUC4_9ACTN|nr:HAMP domain-containing sensor histidine kinase [Allonocardiopsis opalescens]PRX92491.1 signal transduction histidine kinase [Allonocardiopsis opalescens]